MNISEIKDTVSIVDFLQRLGINPPKRQSGQEYFYLSPLRESDTDPSFTVNDIKGKWYDHGEGRGGNIVDLGILMFNEVNVKNVVAKINEMYNGLDTKEYSLQIKHENKTRDKIIKHEIASVKDLGNNFAITNYLELRGVFKSAKSTGLIKEVYYDFINDDGKKTRYFGAGWKNDTGGYDVRSKYGKICIDTKDILTVKGSSDRYVLFEGMMNYLSAIELGEVKEHDNAFILNTTALTQKVVDILKDLDVKDPLIYFDHGSGGRKFTDLIKAELPNSIDRSYIYSGHDDFNNKLVSILEDSCEKLAKLKR